MLQKCVGLCQWAEGTMNGAVADVNSKLHTDANVWGCEHHAPSADSFAMASSYVCVSHAKDDVSYSPRHPTFVTTLSSQSPQ